MDIKYFDSHAHYDDSVFNQDLDIVLKNAYDVGVKKIIDVAYNEKTSNHTIEIANKYEYIYATVGHHPEEVFEDTNIEYISELAKNEKVVAIGEIGLDYHWENDKNLQKKVFKMQIEIANKINKPIIIHNRQADMDVLDILKNEVKPQVPVIFHSFSSSLEIAKEVLKYDWNISFSGTVTFKSARNLHEVAKYVPLEKMLIETDCPYLTPEPYRGTRNDSSKVVYVAKKIAELKEISIEEIANATYNNTCNIFNIKE